MSSSRIPCGFLLALCASFVRPVVADSYTVSDPQFAIVFPAAPQQSAKRLPFEGLGTVQAQRRFLRVESLVLVLSYWDWPSVPEDPGRVLDQVGELTVKPSGGPNDLIGESNITLGGFSGREYRFGRQSVIRMIQRTYLVRSRVYILTVASDDNAPIEKSAVALAFLKSFTLISPQ